MSDLKSGDRSATRVNFPRTAVLCLVALALTALWAGIIYSISLAVGAPISAVVLIPILIAIFIFAMLSMGLATAASDGHDAEDGPADEAK
jgi:hypothetical protein